MAQGQITFFSNMLSRQVTVQTVIPNDLPPEWTKDNPHYRRPMKNLVLLHGFSGYSMDWLTGGLISEAAIKYNIAVFMPSGENSFYLDREASGFRYGSFVGEEIPQYFARLFALSDKKEDWIIGGYSMGGFGALHTAFQFTERYSAVFALSSALIVHKIENLEPGVQDLMANYAYYRDVFGDLKDLESSLNNPEEQVRQNKKAGKPFPKIFMACGTEDFLLNENRSFRDFLKEQEVEFKYQEGPGEHNFIFWNRYLDEALQYIL